MLFSTRSYCGLCCTADLQVNEATEKLHLFLTGRLASFTANTVVVVDHFLVAKVRPVVAVLALVFVQHSM